MIFLIFKMSENIFEYHVFFLITRKKRQWNRSIKATGQNTDLSQIVDIEEREHYGALIFPRQVKSHVLSDHLCFSRPSS